jgi:opacity protein-like surface antigen
MKSIKRFSLLTFLLLSVLPVRAQEHPFRGGLRMAYHVPTKKASRENVDAFIGGGGELGVSFSQRFDFLASVEFVQGRNPNDYAVYDRQGTILDWGPLSEAALSGLLSLRYRLWSRSTPYFGLGLGGSRLSWTIARYRETANAPLGEVFAGYELATSERFRLNLDLRFRSLKADVDWGGVPNDLSGVQISAGSHYTW